MSEEGRQPAYARIAGDIRASILSRHMQPGEGLPTENELAQRYATSRVTVRKALDVLCNEKLIFSRQGKGYFVRKPEYNRYSMVYDFIKPGHEVRFTRMTVIGASEGVGRALSLAVGSPVILIQLILLRDKIPVACEDKFLPYRKGIPSIESLIHYADFPELAGRKMPRHELQCELRLSSGLLDAGHASLLGCASGEPVLLAERTIRTETGYIAGYALAFLREGYGPIAAESGYSTPPSGGSGA